MNLSIKHIGLIKKLGRYKHIFLIAFEAVLTHKFRSFLTALGIIFGVAAVIAMMAIGKGAKQEILDQIKMVGVNNIIITPITEAEKKKEDSEDNEDLETKAENFSPGLNMDDARSIIKIVPSAKYVSPEISYELKATKGSKQLNTTLTGVSSAFFDIFNLELEKGNRFNIDQYENAKAVCILGNKIKSKLFAYENPIGKKIKCDDQWLTVVGVLKSRVVDANTNLELGISNYNESIYIPIQTILSRFSDQSSRGSGVMGGLSFLDDFLSFADMNKKNPNQLNKIIVQVDKSKNLGQTSKIIEKMLKRRHNEVDDFEIKVPELLLKQEQRTKVIFNIVLAAIASISLIVGGIGIMNIMLASVLERIREIGLRLSIGARKKDIIIQFLTESTFISLSGGLAGILIGILLAKLITQLTDIHTIIDPLSILVSFGVSAGVGILFGFMPARKAAHQDPVTSLRHD